jgi:hypothetical protein
MRSLRRLARLTLVPVGALVVHQLRFALAYGPDAGAQLQRQGHAYLHSLAPWIALLLALGVGCFLWALGRALAGQRSVPRYAISLAALWVLCFGCLVALYASQELLEGMLSTGHPGGLAGVFGFGGWWAIPAAACVGLVLAAILHGARWVLDEVAGRARRSAPPAARSSAALPRPLDALLPRTAPLAAGWSGRGPPR